MINRFEAIGIFISVALMAMALFLINIEQAMPQPNSVTDSGRSNIVVEGDNQVAALYSSLDETGKLNNMVIDDVVVGSGEAVVSGDTVSVHYIGTLQNGQPFDNSYLKGSPFEFTVGSGQVIKGWDEGVVGMKVGGQRILVIPAEMAYGDKPVGPIPANSNLVFAVELLEIK